MTGTGTLVPVGASPWLDVAVDGILLPGTAHFAFGAAMAEPLRLGTHDGLVPLALTSAGPGALGVVPDSPTGILFAGADGMVAEATGVRGQVTAVRRECKSWIEH